MTYTFFNLCFGIFILFGAFILTRRWADWLLMIRASLVLTAISYPWDFFAIKLKAWIHPDPGPRLFVVPINDLVFIFLCTLLSTALFLRLRKRHISHPNR